MRHVFPTDQIAHKWAHQTQDNARNGQGNLFFEQEILFSYRHSYPIAKLYKKYTATLVLLNSDTYSVTTARHIALARYATNHLTQCHVPHIIIATDSVSDLLTHEANLKYLLDQTLALQNKAGRAQSLSTVEYLERQAVEQYNQAIAYNNFFQVYPELVPCPSFQASKDRRIRLESPDPVRDAKAYKAKLSRDKSKAKKQEREEAIDFIQMSNTWHALEKWANHMGPKVYAYRYYDIPVFLRAVIKPNGDEVIETSRGAEVPTEHAKRLYKIICNMRTKGETYQRNGHTIHVGSFPLDKIDSEGNINVGCHYITFNTIHALAVKLGWNEVQHV